MSIVKFKRGLEEKVDTFQTPLEDGSLLFTENEGGLYIDSATERKQIGTKAELVTVKDKTRSNVFGENSDIKDLDAVVDRLKNVVDRKQVGLISQGIDFPAEGVVWDDKFWLVPQLNETATLNSIKYSQDGLTWFNLEGCPEFEMPQNLYFTKISDAEIWLTAQINPVANKTTVEWEYNLIKIAKDIETNGYIVNCYVLPFADKTSLTTGIGYDDINETYYISTTEGLYKANKDFSTIEKVEGFNDNYLSIYVVTSVLLAANTPPFILLQTVGAVTRYDIIDNVLTNSTLCTWDNTVTLDITIKYQLFLEKYGDIIGYENGWDLVAQTFDVMNSSADNVYFFSLYNQPDIHFYSTGLLNKNNLTIITRQHFRSRYSDVIIDYDKENNLRMYSFTTGTMAQMNTVPLQIGNAPNYIYATWISGIADFCNSKSILLFGTNKTNTGKVTGMLKKGDTFILFNKLVKDRITPKFYVISQNNGETWFDKKILIQYLNNEEDNEFWEPLDNHIANKNNPHGVTAEQVGLKNAIQIGPINTVDENRNYSSTIYDWNVTDLSAYGAIEQYAGQIYILDSKKNKLYRSSFSGLKDRGSKPITLPTDAVWNFIIPFSSSDYILLSDSETDKYVFNRAVKMLPYAGYWRGIYTNNSSEPVLLVSENANNINAILLDANGNVSRQFNIPNLIQGAKLLTSFGNKFYIGCKNSNIVVKISDLNSTDMKFTTIALPEESGGILRMFKNGYFTLISDTSKRQFNRFNSASQTAYDICVLPNNTNAVEIIDIDEEELNSNLLFIILKNNPLYIYNQNTKQGEDALIGNYSSSGFFKHINYFVNDDFNYHYLFSNLSQANFYYSGDGYKYSCFTQSLYADKNISLPDAINETIAVSSTGNQLRKHIADRDNPHKITLSQLAINDTLGLNDAFNFKTEQEKEFYLDDGLGLRGSGFVNEHISVAMTYQSNKYYYSLDQGKTYPYTSKFEPDSPDYYEDPMAYVYIYYVNNKYICLKYDGTSKKIYVLFSDDCINWSTPELTNLSGKFDVKVPLFYFNNKYCIVERYGESQGQNRLYISDDMINFISYTTPFSAQTPSVFKYRNDYYCFARIKDDTNQNISLFKLKPEFTFELIDNNLYSKLEVENIYKFDTFYSFGFEFEDILYLTNKTAIYKYNIDTLECTKWLNLPESSQVNAIYVFYYPFFIRANENTLICLPNKLNTDTLEFTRLPYSTDYISYDAEFFQYKQRGIGIYNNMISATTRIQTIYDKTHKWSQNYDLPVAPVYFYLDDLDTIYINLPEIKPIIMITNYNLEQVISTDVTEQIKQALGINDIALSWIDF